MTKKENFGEQVDIYKKLIKCKKGSTRWERGLRKIKNLEEMLEYC